MANLEYEENTSANTGNFLKPKKGSGSVNIVNDFAWTLSPKESRSEVPKAYLVEYQQTGGQLIASLIYYARIANQGIGSLTSPDQKEVYKYKYLAEPTGWTYDIPFLSKHHTNRSNSFGYDDGKNPFSQMASIGQTMLGYNTKGGLFSTLARGSSWIGSMAGAGEAAINTVLPGKISLETPQSWSDTSIETITIKFHLFNTQSMEDVINNRNLAHLLRYNNSPNRDNFAVMAPPVIYSLKIPDIVYMPACYMSALEINNLGNTSDYQINGKFRTIPEAYDFSMTFTSLLIPSRNILRALDNDDVVEAINNVEGMRQIVGDLAREGYRIATNDGNTPLTPEDFQRGFRISQFGNNINDIVTGRR